MTNLEIFQQVDARMNKIKELITPEIFVLNKEIMKLKDEIRQYQKQCNHEFVDGKCKYCLKREGGN